MVRLALLIEHLLRPKHSQNSVWQPPELNYNFWVRHSKFSQMQLYFHSNSFSTLPDPTSETILLCVVHRHVGFHPLNFSSCLPPSGIFSLCNCMSDLYFSGTFSLPFFPWSKIISIYVFLVTFIFHLNFSYFDHVLASLLD